MPVWNNPNESRNAHLMPPSAHAQYGYAPSQSTAFGPDMYQPTTYHVLATPLHDRLGRTQEKKRNPTLKGVFTKDLKSLMYGFGDDFYGTPESVSVMEDILVEFITNVCHTAAGPSKKGRLQVEDLRRVFTRPPDHKKLARMEELLFMQEDIKRARQAFDDDRIPEPA